MPSGRPFNYIQESFILGEQKTAVSERANLNNSVQSLTNYYVTKAGHLTRRPGLEIEYKFDKGRGETYKKIVELQTERGVLVFGLTETSINGGGSVFLFSTAGRTQRILFSQFTVKYHPLTYGDVNINEDATETHIDLGLGIQSVAGAPSGRVTNIIPFKNYLLVITEVGLPYVIEADADNLIIRPYFFTPNTNSYYDDLVRAYPIELEPTVFQDVVFSKDGNPINNADIQPVSYTHLTLPTILLV